MVYVAGKLYVIPQPIWQPISFNTTKRKINRFSKIFLISSKFCLKKQINSRHYFFFFNFGKTQRNYKSKAWQKFCNFSMLLEDNMTICTKTFLKSIYFWNFTIMNLHLGISFKEMVINTFKHVCTGMIIRMLLW